MNGAADAVHVTLVIAMELAPEVRLPFARTLSVGVPLVLTFAVTDTVELAGMLGVVVGLASGKLIVVGLMVSSARAETVALIVRVCVLCAEETRAHSRPTNVNVRTADTRRPGNENIFVTIVGPKRGVIPAWGLQEPFPRTLSSTQ